MIKSVFGEDLDGTIHKLFPFLFRRVRIHPDTADRARRALVSTLRRLGSSRSGEFLAAGLLRSSLLGGFFDLVDGVVARHFRDFSSTFGGFLDSTLDRLVDIVLMAWLGIVIHFSGIGDFHTCDGCGRGGVALVSSVLTSYAKARAELAPVRKSQRAACFERGERVGSAGRGRRSWDFWCSRSLWIARPRYHVHRRFSDSGWRTGR